MDYISEGKNRGVVDHIPIGKNRSVRVVYYIPWEKVVL